MSVLKKVMCLIQWCLGKFSMCYKREIYCSVRDCIYSLACLLILDSSYISILVAGCTLEDVYRNLEAYWSKIGFML